jgi:hypothetical protein
VVDIDRAAVGLLIVALFFFYAGFMLGRIRAAELFNPEIWKLQDQLQRRREAHRKTWTQLEQAQRELAALKAGGSAHG